jgi:hypothetical protein
MRGYRRRCGQRRGTLDHFPFRLPVISGKPG